MPDTPDDAPDPVPVPCRLALGICAHVLHGRAAVLRQRDDGPSSRVAGRHQHAFRLEQDAVRLLGLSRAPDAARWPSSDAALLGHLAAYLMGDPSQWDDLLAEMAEAGRTMPPGTDRNALADVAVLALGVPTR